MALTHDCIVYSNIAARPDHPNHQRASAPAHDRRHTEPATDCERGRTVMVRAGEWVGRGNSNKRLQIGAARRRTYPSLGAAKGITRGDPCSSAARLPAREKSAQTPTPAGGRGKTERLSSAPAMHAERTRRSSGRAAIFFAAQFFWTATSPDRRRVRCQVFRCPTRLRT